VVTYKTSVIAPPVSGCAPNYHGDLNNEPIDSASMILKFWNAPSSVDDGSNRHEIAVARGAAGAARVSMATDLDGQTPAIDQVA
jgi:hypothetical protein